MVDPELLKQVELLRGPASALWGSDALGGVMLVSTREPEDLLNEGEHFAGRFRSGYESAAAEAATSAMVATRWAELEALGSFSQRDAEDYRLADGREQPHSGLRTRSGLAKLGWRPDRGPHRFGLIRQQFSQAGISPSNPAQDAGETNPLIDLTSEQHYGVLRYQYDPDAPGRLQAAQLHLYRDGLDLREDRVGAPRADRTLFRTEGAHGHLSLARSGRHGSALLTVGAEYFRDRAHATRDGAPRPQYPDSQRSIGGVFLQVELELGSVSLVPGLRYDRYAAESNTDAARELREAKYSPKLGLVYRASDSLRLRAGYNAAFRAPALIEIYAAGQHFLGNEFVPNPDLRPEDARTLELGLSWERPGLGAGQRLRVDGSAFRNRVRDFIELSVETTSEPLAPQCLPPRPALGCVNRNDDGSADPGTPPVFVGGTTTSRNLAQATLTGGELDVQYGNEVLALGLSYSRVRGRSDDNGAALGSIPADRLRAALQLQPERRLRSTLAYTHRFAQDRVPRDAQGEPLLPPTPPYATWDWSASWEPAQSPRGLRELRLVLGVDNLGNEDYRDHLNVLRSPGRNWRASVSVGF